MANRSQASNIDDYIAEFPEEVQDRLTEIRQLVHSIVPEATETISYAIPTFDLKGKHLVHFAGYPHHVGFYPTGSGQAQFQDELTAAGYKTGKGSVQFPLSEPLPTDLIRRMVEFRVAQVLGK